MTAALYLIAVSICCVSLAIKELSKTIQKAIDNEETTDSLGD